MRSALFFLLLSPSVAFAIRCADYPHLPCATFRDQKASSGTCFAPLSESAATVLARHQIQTPNGRYVGRKSVQASGGSDPRLAENMARIVQKIESLTGRKDFGPFRKLNVWNVPNLDILARQTSQGITMRSDSTDNISNIAHELGHQVGNSPSRKGPLSWYGLYNKEVSQPCRFTAYCHANHGHGPRNEEFAEVFAAYLSNPQMLLNGDPACRKAYDFLRSQMFTAKNSDCHQGPVPSVVRKPQAAPAKAPTPAPAPAVKPEDCETPDLLGKNGKDLRDTMQAVETAVHVSEHAQPIEEEPAEEKSRSTTTKKIDDTLATFISYSPIVLQLIMGHQAAQQQYQQVMPNLMPVQYVNPVMMPPAAPMSAPPNLAPHSILPVETSPLPNLPTPSPAPMPSPGPGNGNVNQR